MRVLHFLPCYAPAWQYGGPILSVSRLCEGLFQLGVDVRVITTNAGLPDFPTDQLGVPQYINGVQVTYYPVDSQTGVIKSKALVDSLPDHIEWAQILHLSSIWQPLGIPIQKAAHTRGVPVVQTLRGALGPYSWTRSPLKKFIYFQAIEKQLLSKASMIHCTSAQELKEASRFTNNLPTTILPNPCDFDRLHLDVDVGLQWRMNNDISTTEPLLLVAGRLHHKKGLELLPDMLNTLKSQRWTIAFIGSKDDKTYSRLRSRFDAFGISDRCHWFDPLPSDSLIGPYNASNVLLLPSHHENFGNVAIEALACGTSVFMSPSVGVASMLAGCPGAYVIPRDPSLWASSLLDNVFSSPRPSESSSSWVVNKFGVGTISTSAFKMYSHLLYSSCKP